MATRRWKKIWRYVYSFWQNARTWRTHTDRQTQTSHDDIGLACIASRDKNESSIILLFYCNRKYASTEFYFMPPLPILRGRHYAFALSVPACVRPEFCPAPSVFSSLRKNTERISMKFAGSNHYHEQIKWLHFGRNWNTDDRYDRIFDSTSIAVVAMTNRCWRLANDFTDCTAQTTAISR